MARRSVVRNIQAERNALRDTLKSGAEGGANNRYARGTNVPQLLNDTPGLRQLTQESINMRAYGTGNPTFTKPTGQRPMTTMPVRGGYNSAPTQAPGVMQPRSGYDQTQPAPSAAPTQPNIYEQMMSQINSRYGQSPTFDEAKTREQNMTDLQSQIDAIKQKYVGTISAAQQQGAGRLGQQRGLSTISGTRFSPRGTAEQTNVENANQQQIDAINANMNAEIAAATTASSGALQQQLQYGGEQASRQADSYLSNMMSAYGLFQGDRQAQEEQAARYAQLTGMYGGNPTMDMRRYLSDSQNQNFQQDLSNRELEARIAQAQQKNYSLSQLDDGTVVAFDPQTGQMNTLGRYAKPVASSGGGGSRYGGGDPLSSAAMRAYYQAYGTLPSESLIPYYSDLYSNEAQPLQGPGYDYSSPSAYSNPFMSGAATYDSRYGRDGAGSSDNPYGNY